MTIRPAFLAAALILASLPLLSMLGPPPAVIATAFVTSTIIFAVLYRRGITIRDALRELAKGDLSRSPALENERDLLGVADAFASMRQELDRAIRRLAAADAQRRRLFADLAHELATPASALLGLGDTLGDVPVDDATRAQLLTRIETETLRIARLCEDIRDLAELDDPDVVFQRERVKLEDIVRRAVAAFAADADLVMTAPAEVDADEHWLEQAIGNILDNAKRYAPDQLIRVAVDGASITIDDSGPGVPPEMLGQLGERLFRVDAARDRRKGGHGLGLSIVRAVMRRHDGDVRFEPAPTGGLRAVLVLPVKSDKRN